MNDDKEPKHSPESYWDQLKWARREKKITGKPLFSEEVLREWRRDKEGRKKGYMRKWWK